MKILNSWVSAVVVCSAIASQANADVLMFASADSDAVAVTNLNSFAGVGNHSVNTKRATSQTSPTFVPGSLINKSNQGTQLMSLSVQAGSATRPGNVSSMAARGLEITPTPPAGSESRPVSTFAQFVQIFKPSQNANDDIEAAHTTVNEDVTPKTSSMAYVGLFASGLAGITGLITASRRGFFFRAVR